MSKVLEYVLIEFLYSISLAKYLKDRFKDFLTARDHEIIDLEKPIEPSFKSYYQSMLDADLVAWYLQAKFEEQLTERDQKLIDELRERAHDLLAPILLSIFLDPAQMIYGASQCVDLPQEYAKRKISLAQELNKPEKANDARLRLKFKDATPETIRDLLTEEHRTLRDPLARWLYGNFLLKDSV